MTHSMIIGGTALALAAAFFFFRMRSVAQQIDEQCTVMMNVALSLLVVIPPGLGVLASGMIAWNKAGADMVMLAGALSLSGGLVLVPLALKNGIRRLEMTQEEKENDLFS